MARRKLTEEEKEAKRKKDQAEREEALRLSRIKDLQKNNF